MMSQDTNRDSNISMNQENSMKAIEEAMAAVEVINREAEVEVDTQAVEIKVEANSMPRNK